MMGPTLSTFAWGCGEQEKDDDAIEIPDKAPVDQTTTSNGTVTHQIEAQDSSVVELEGTRPELTSTGQEQPGEQAEQGKVKSEETATGPDCQGHLEGEGRSEQTPAGPLPQGQPKESQREVEIESVETSPDTELSFESIPNSEEAPTKAFCEEVCKTNMATEVISPLETSVEERDSTVSTVPLDTTSPSVTDLSPSPKSSMENVSVNGVSAEELLRSSESPEPDTSAVPASSSSSADTQKDEDEGEADLSSPRSGAADENGGAAAATKEEQNGKAAPVKPKKKEDKSIEYILRALSSLSTPEEKLAALCKKYADLHEEHRVLQSSFKQQQRRMTVVTREKDQLQAEHTKAVIAKSKLESLCRELQKHNKLIKEESLQRAKEEDEKRKEISARFQATIGEIQTQMTDNHEKNVKLREENADLAGKLKKFIEQYEVREQQLEKLMKHRELEQQLADAKLQKAAAILKEEQERNLKEKEILVLQATEGVKKNTVLEAQLTMYKDRYEEFQATINKSNDMFQKLKGEMDKMGKRIKKLEKEGAQWRAKWETSNKALLEMAEEKTHTDKEKQMLQTKVQKLESLCRALQGEMHGKKSASPQTLPPEAECPGDSPRETALVTTTPPNTPENTSRASPDSTSGPPALGDQLASVAPPKQNGPLAAPSASSEADSTSPPSATQPPVSLDPSKLDQTSSSGPAVDAECAVSSQSPESQVSWGEAAVSSSGTPQDAVSTQEETTAEQVDGVSSSADAAV